MTSLHHPPDTDVVEPVTDVTAPVTTEPPATSPAAPDAPPPSAGRGIPPARTPGAPVSLMIGAFVTLLVSAWAGVVPYLGPAFGLSADGASSWTWDRAHAIDALLPGAVGVVASLFIIAAARRPVGLLSTASLRTWGLVLFACGAWLSVAPVVWPVVVGPYFVAASPSATLAHWLAYASGPGLVVAGFGAYTIGRAGRPVRAATR